ncbi:MAG: hypothetical protein KatS3mg008_2124 [Acidimicrobiales bacterium]|nr:MAG: hypothetical protein KatS3mg008_2124 [Acidimicrobiales bacterium]
MPHLLLAGAPTGCWTNAGDQLVLAGMLHRLRKEFGDVEVGVVSSNPPGLLEGMGVGAVHYADVAGLVRAVQQADLVVIGGGSILFDWWGADPTSVATPSHSGLSLWATVAALARACGTPSMLYAVGIGPLRTADGRLLARAVLESVDAVSVRDPHSALAARALGFDGEVEVTADPALAAPLPEPVPTAGRLCIAVAPRLWDMPPTPPDWLARVSDGLRTLVEEHDASVYAVPFHRRVPWPLSDDEEACLRIATELGDRVRTLEVTRPWQGRIKTLVSADVVVAARYHALLASLAAGTPALALCYDPKVRNLAEDWGFGELALELVDLRPDLVESRLRAALDRRDELAAKASERLEVLRQREERTARLAVATAERRRASGPSPAMRRVLDEIGGDEEFFRRTGVRFPSGTAPDRRKTSVAILTNQVLDRQTGRPRIGGAERYCLELARLLEDLGCAVEIHQLEGDWGEGLFHGFPVHALPRKERWSEFETGLAEEFARRARDRDHAIYLMPHYASGVLHPSSVVVSHGVWWDHDLWSHLEMRTPGWWEHIRSVYSGRAPVVSVDTNTVNVLRAVAPELPSPKVIPNMVDTALFRPGGTDEPSLTPTIVVPRRADVIRGPRMVADLLELIPEPCRLVWVGGGDPKIIEELRELAERDSRLEVSDVPLEQMPDVYRAADICLIPTIASEGQSLACLEAMASGLPVVVTRVGGLPELVRDGVEGFLCDPEPASIAHALRKLIADPRLRTELGERARQTALRHSVWHWRHRWASFLRDIGWLEGRALGRAVPYDVVVFAIVDWEFRRQRPQQLAEAWAARGRRVWYLTADPEVSAPETHSPTEGVTVVRIPVPRGFHPHRGEPTAGALRTVMDALHELRERSSISRAVSVVQVAGWTRHALEARRRFGWPVVYDCMDDWRTFPGFRDDAAFLTLERRLVEQADLVVTSSRTIQRRWEHVARKTILARNAADVDTFRRPAVCDPLATVPPPVAGFFGAITEWFDRELVEEVARRLPEVQFVLIGGVYRTEIGRLGSMPNVHMLGPVPYDHLPDHLERFDVCLVPFRVCETTEGMDVVKAYEYFARGKPIVATPIAELRHLSPIVTLASEPAEFAEAIRIALESRAEAGSPESARRRALASANTWAARVEQIDEALLDVVARTGWSPAQRGVPIAM